MSDVISVFLCFRFQFSASGRVGICVVMLFVFLVRNDEKRRKRIGEEGREGKGMEVRRGEERPEQSRA